MRSKAQLLKTASTLQQFTSKIKQAQEGEVLTPEAVQDIAMEIQQVAEVAAELAVEIAENVPVEEVTTDIIDDKEEITEESGPAQIEVAQDDTEDDKEKKELKEQVAGLVSDLNNIKREAGLAKYAQKYASLFPKNMREAKINEILTSKLPLAHIQTKVQEASDIITNKTMVKIASQTDSIFDFSTDTESEEVNIASKM